MLDQTQKPKRAMRGIPRKTASVSFPDSTLQVLDGYATARGICRSMAIVELIEQMRPALIDVTNAINTAKTRPMQGIEQIKQTLKRAMAAAEAAQGELTI